MNNLKALRTQKGIYQKDIASFLNVAVSTYSYWEQGKFEPDSETLKKLADYFNVSVDYLLGRETHTTIDTIMGLYCQELFSVEMTSRGTHCKEASEVLLRLVYAIFPKKSTIFLFLQRNDISKFFHLKYNCLFLQNHNDSKESLFYA